MFDIKKGYFGHQRTFEAAQALGISVVVVDQQGHWLEGETYSYLQDDFIAVDVTDDAKLLLRIAEALKGKTNSRDCESSGNIESSNGTRTIIPAGPQQVQGTQSN
jgi:hypothetical protein